MSGVSIPPSEIARKYEVVSAYTTIEYEHVVPNGKTLVIAEFGGSGVSDENAQVSLVWDHEGTNEEVLFSTTGDIVQTNLRKNYIGDGVKKMTIILDNQCSSSHLMGAYYLGEEIDG